MTDQKRKHADALTNIQGQLQALDDRRAELLARQRARVLAARADGLTLQQIADIMGLTKGRISQIEKGTR